ncbi:hypothetical protein E9529_12380 [Blastococcus sp. KM273128]|uniref:DUF6518 family protein n=1 Tax=Blastococcus sp. KM273128 TaxID=2570314 RepID=UPI001F4416F8|nr:DUF6518 family protein [Blastococcus sp. KM273128]MCF6745061.1 hypothetical protein [Blastococcus sp. KM273128]
MDAVLAPPRTAREPLRLAVAALGGVLAGVAAKAADESGWRWAADLGTYPAAWVLAVALIGRAAPSLLPAAVRAAVFFAAMTLAYYAYAAWVLHFGWNRLLPVWLGLSATAVALTSAGVWWATRRSGPLPGAVLALAAGIVLARGEFLALWWAVTDPVDGAPAPVHPVQGVVDAAVALVLVLVLPRSRSARVWGLLLLAPATVLALRLSHVFGGLIG